MSVQKAKTRRRISQQRRSDPIQGSGEVKNGSAETGADPAPVIEPGLHLLGRQLQPITRFESFESSDPLTRKLFDIIDTEEKQLQAIGDLFSILKAQPKYKNLRDQKWKVQESPVRVLRWILRKLGPLADGDHWTVDTFRQGKKTRFCFVVYRHFPNYWLKPKEVYIPLDFLPALLNRDQPLHDLIIDVFALLNKCNDLPLWDCDGDYSAQLRRIKKEEPSTGNRFIDAQVVNYKSGPAAKYLALLRSRRQAITIAKFRKALNAYSDTSDRKGDIKHWLRRALWIAETRENLTPWSYLPHYLPGNPISPLRQYKVVWSLHPNDIIHSRAQGLLKKDSKDGDFYPVMFSVTRPGEVLRPLEHSQFPEALFTFMEHGWKILFTRYHQYFYKQSFSEQKPVTLLEIIELEELRAGI